MTLSVEKDASMIKGPDESQTAFTIRRIQAQAWDEGHDACPNGCGRWDSCTGNPYRVTPPGEGRA